MSIFRLISISLLVIFASLIHALPVAEDRSQTERPVERSHDASSVADHSSDPSPDLLAGRGDKQVPSFESGQEGSASSLAHALEITPTSEAEAAQKRDDIRKYDKPRPWSYDDYRAVYLAGLSRIASEGGNRKDRRSSPKLQPDSSRSKEDPIEKRDSEGNYDSKGNYDRPRPPPSREQNLPDPSGTDNWGLTLDDYHRFLVHNLDSNWQRWDDMRWLNFANRYHEFQASGGQVGGGWRAKRENWVDGRADDLGESQPALRKRDLQDLEETSDGQEVLERDSLGKYEKNMIDEDGRLPRDQVRDYVYWESLMGLGARGNSQAPPKTDAPTSKRDSVHKYEKQMFDEDGRGGREHEEDTAIWEELMGLTYGGNRQRSENNAVRRSPRVPQDDVEDKTSDQVATPTSSAEARLFEEQRNDDPHDSNLTEEHEIVTSNDYLLFRQISLLQQQLLGRKKLAFNEEISSTPMTGEIAKLCVDEKDQNDLQSGSSESECQEAALQDKPAASQHQRRDDIRNYADWLSDMEWVRLMRVGAVRPSIRLSRENSNPKMIRDAVSIHRTQPNYVSLSEEDFMELSRIASTDPAFKAFQEQDSAGSAGGGRKEKRSPIPPDVHQTAPVHKGPPHAGTNNVAAGNSSTTSNSSGNDSSPGHLATRGDDNAEQKRTVAESEDLDNETNRKTKGDDLQRASPAYPQSSYHAPKAATIAEVIAAEDAAELGDDASVEAKRDSMRLYEGGLDDWDDCVLSRMFSDTDCMDDLETHVNPRRKEEREQKRDSEDKYLHSGPKWDNYGELLKAMEEGRLSSFFPARDHPRDLTSLPAWGPASDPHPPSSDRRDISNSPSQMPTNDIVSSDIDTEPLSRNRKRVDSGGLTVFPSWEPAGNPSPPEKSRETPWGKKERRDGLDQDSKGEVINKQGKSSYSSQDSSLLLSKINQPSSSKPNRLNFQSFSQDEVLSDGDQTEVKRHRRDGTSQYDEVMSDEDEWVDIYRLWRMHRDREGIPHRSKRSQRRTPMPDTVFIRPGLAGKSQPPYYTTTSNTDTPSSTGLISLIGNVPGPGTTSVSALTSSPTPQPSALFFPFGTLIPLGPEPPAATPVRKRMEDNVERDVRRKRMQYVDGHQLITSKDSNASDKWLLRDQEETPEYGPVKEKRQPISTASSQSIALLNASPTIQIQNQSSTSTSTPAPIFDSSSLSNIIENLGPLLALASSIPPPPPSATALELPEAGTTLNNTTKPPTSPRKRETTTVHDTSSVQNWDDSDWDRLDNFITFQDAESPVKRHPLTPPDDDDDQTPSTNPGVIMPQTDPAAPQVATHNTSNYTATPTPTTAQPATINGAASYTGPLNCLFFNADPALDVPAGCFCQGDETALPTMAGEDPCAYTTLPATAISTPAAGVVAGARRDAVAGLEAREVGKAVQARDDEGQYHRKPEEAAIWAWVMSGASRPQRPQPNSPGGKRDEVQAEVHEAVAKEQKNVEEKGKEEDAEEEKAQQLEGQEQGLMEVSGGRLRRRGFETGEREGIGKRFMWVPEEEDLIDGFPEGAGESNGGDDGMGFKEKVKRHCGRGLPEGYGDQGNVTDLCGGSG